MTLIARIARHWSDPESPHRRIAVGFLTVAGFVLVAKLVGAAKEMAIAWRYGTAPQMDAYAFVFNLVTWPVAVWFSALMVVVVPLVARLRMQGAAQVKQFLQELTGLNLLLACAATIAAAVLLPVALRRWSGLEEQALTTAITWARPMSLLCGMGMVIALQSVLVLAGNRHQNSLLEAVPSLVLLGVLLLPLPQGGGGEPLLWGTLAGFALHLVCVAGILHWQGMWIPPRLGFASPAWTTFRTGMATMLAAQALASSTSLLDQWLAAPLGAGAVSVLAYASRVLALLLGLGAMALSRATLPVLAQARAAGDSRLDEITSRWVRWVLLAGLVMMSAAWPLALPAVRLLFERGAFTPADSAAVAQALRFGLLQVPPYFASLVLISHFSAQHLYGPVLLFGVGGLVAKLAAAWLLTPLLGLGGIMLSSAAFYAAGLVLLAQQRRGVPAQWR